MPERRALTKYTTPIGEFRWPYITRANQYGNYEVDFVLPADESKGLIDLLKKEAKEQAKRQPLKDAQGNIRWASVPYKEADGMVTFKARQKAKVTNKKTQEVMEFSVAIFDAQKNQIDPATISPGTGTKGRLGLELNPYTTSLAGVGCALRLRAVQIIDYVEYIPKDGAAEAFDFGESEGFVKSASEPSEDMPPADDDMPF